MTSTVEQMTRQRALLLALEGPGDEWRESLEELTRLAETAGAEVVGTVTQKRDAPDPVHFVGKGKAREIRQIRGDTGAEVILVDGDLSPSQERNLEEAAATDVLDRTGLILDIFARRARSREGKVQVELAQLNYLLPRLTGKGKELSRLGGGIGTRGPGETKLEADRKRIRKRISLLRKQVERIGKRREIERRHRQEARAPRDEHLEVDLRADLDLARADHRARDLAEVLATEVGIRLIELRGVKGVERLEPQFHPHALPDEVEWYLLEQREIEVVHAIPSQDAAANVAEREWRRHRQC